MTSAQQTNGSASDRTNLAVLNVLSKELQNGLLDALNYRLDGAEVDDEATAEDQCSAQMNQFHVGGLPVWHSVLNTQMSCT